jgi:hypothetical protein
MRGIHAISRLLMVGVPVALLAGCDLLTDSKEPAPSTDANWEATTDLESEYGGYTFSDESEAFGDPEVQKQEADEASEAVATGDSLPGDSLFALRVLWGQLEGNRDADVTLDWTGNISVSAGKLRVLRTIAFERPGDHLLPRENLQTVNFTSHTRPHFDGLLLLVAPPSPDSAVAGDPTLTFATGPYAGTWTLAELRNGNLVIPVDSLGNAVSLTGVPIGSLPCPEGFLRGIWMRRTGERGILKGVWVAADGLPIGHMRGHFGINEEGARVWFAKILGRGGRVIGLAKGTWEPSTDPANPGGTFTGEFHKRPGLPEGRIAGHYLPGREGPRGAAGFFEGRWKVLCPEGE